MKTTIITLLLFLLAICTMGGCGSSLGDVERAYTQIGLAEVIGTVTLDGQPLADAQIQFVEGNSPDGAFCYGITDSNGKYRLWCDSQHTGALPGSKTVRIWTTMKGPGFDQLMKAPYPSKETIPVVYNHKSTLSAVIEPNKRQTFDFDIKTGGKSVNAPNAGEPDSAEK